MIQADIIMPMSPEVQCHGPEVAAILSRDPSGSSCMRQDSPSWLLVLSLISVSSICGLT